MTWLEFLNLSRIFSCGTESLLGLKSLNCFQCLFFAIAFAFVFVFDSQKWIGASSRALSTSLTLTVINNIDQINSWLFLLKCLRGMIISWICPFLISRIRILLFRLVRLWNEPCVCLPSICNLSCTKIYLLGKMGKGFSYIFLFKKPNCETTTEGFAFCSNRK